MTLEMLQLGWSTSIRTRNDAIRTVDKCWDSKLHSRGGSTEAQNVVVGSIDEHWSPGCGSWGGRRVPGFET